MAVFGLGCILSFRVPIISLPFPKVVAALNTEILRCAQDEGLKLIRWDGGDGIYGTEDFVGVGVEDYGAVLGGFVVG